MSGSVLPTLAAGSVHQVQPSTRRVIIVQCRDPIAIVAQNSAQAIHTSTWPCVVATTDVQIHHTAARREQQELSHFSTGNSNLVATAKSRRQSVIRTQFEHVPSAAPESTFQFHAVTLAQHRTAGGRRACDTHRSALWPMAAHRRRRRYRQGRRAAA